MTPSTPFPLVPNPDEPLLSVRGVSVRFGGIVALDGVSFDVERGGICGLIGPNGAGKTTLFNCLSRLYPYQAGDIVFDGRSITHTPTHRIAALGMGRTFQNLAMFRTMPVRENVMVGAHCRSSRGFLSGALRLPGVSAEEARLRQRAAQILDELALTPFAQRPVGDLPFGIQKRVEFARALAAEPTLLLLDEPAAGLRHHEKQALAAVLRQLKADGISLLLVEHDMDFVMGLADRVVVMEFGTKLMEGTPAQVQASPAVRAAYLGTEH